MCLEETPMFGGKLVGDEIQQSTPQREAALAEYEIKIGQRARDFPGVTPELVQSAGPPGIRS